MLLGVTARTVANWADAGLLPHHVTGGGHRRFRSQDVHGFLDERRRRPAGQLPERASASPADAGASSPKTRRRVPPKP